MEINRLSSPSTFVLDAVIQIIDVENWTGYSDTSFTAKLQSKYTDLIILNKHELCTPLRVDNVIDLIRDVAEETPIIRSDRGSVPVDLLFGIDTSLAKNLVLETETHEHGHSSEVEVLSLRLPGPGFVDTDTLTQLLKTAPKDEVYRIKGILRIPASHVPHDHKSPTSFHQHHGDDPVPPYALFINTGSY